MQSLSLKQALDYIEQTYNEKYCVRTLKNWIKDKDNEFNARKIGGRWRVSKATIDSYFFCPEPKNKTDLSLVSEAA